MTRLTSKIEGISLLDRSGRPYLSPVLSVYLLLLERHWRAYIACEMNTMRNSS